MGLTALQMLWLAPVFTLTTQEFVGLSVSPRISAQCGKQATLQCKISPAPKGLSIRRMMWAHAKTVLCSVNSEGNVSHNHSAVSDLQCVFEDGQLSLVLRDVRPDQGSGTSGPYMCKLQSNMGVSQEYTAVELEECGGIVHGTFTRDGPACTFSHVHPDGDVHWFQGSHNLSGASVNHHTSKRVEEGGWLTVHSYLKRGSSEGPYNCSLRSTTSGRYIASTVISNNVHKYSSSQRSGVRPQGPVGACLCFAVLLAALLK